MIKYFQFNRNGKEIIQLESYFEPINKKHQTINEIKTLEKECVEIEVNISDLQNTIKKEELNPEKYELTTKETNILKKHENLQSKLEEIEEYATEQYLKNHNLDEEFFQMTKHWQLVNYGLNDNEHSKKIHESLQEEINSLDIRVGQIVDKRDFVLQRKNKINSLNKTLAYKKEAILNLKNSDGKQEERISLSEEDRLNIFVKSFETEGWRLLSITPIVSGIYNTFGSSSNLNEFGGTVYPSGGYGCSFTDGLMLHFEK